MDWTDPTVSESAEEREAEMSSLAAGFVARMCKRAANTQGEATPGFEGPDDKRYKQSGPAEEVQISPAMVSVDSLERAPDTLSTFEGDAWGASLEACASLKDGALTGEPPLDDKVANKALPSGEAGGPSLRARRLSLTLFGAWRTRPPNKLILGSYVKPPEWSRPAADASAPDQEAACLLIRGANETRQLASYLNSTRSNLDQNSTRVSSTRNVNESS